MHAVNVRWFESRVQLARVRGPCPRRGCVFAPPFRVCEFSDDVVSSVHFHLCFFQCALCRTKFGRGERPDTMVLMCC